VVAWFGWMHFGPGLVGGCCCVSARDVGHMHSTTPTPTAVCDGRIYLAIPLLLEMRSLLDWVSTRTSLDLFMFLRLKTIHTEAFLNKCEMRYRERDRDVLEGKMPQVWRLGGRVWGDSGSVAWGTL
jgi:hypothetical protein